MSYIDIEDDNENEILISNNKNKDKSLPIDDDDYDDDEKIHLDIDSDTDKENTDSEQKNDKRKLLDIEIPPLNSPNVPNTVILPIATPSIQLKDGKVRCGICKNEYSVKLSHCSGSKCNMKNVFFDMLSKVPEHIAIIMGDGLVKCNKCRTNYSIRLTYCKICFRINKHYKIKYSYDDPLPDFLGTDKNFKCETCHKKYPINSLHFNICQKMNLDRLKLTIRDANNNVRCKKCHITYSKFSQYCPKCFKINGLYTDWEVMELLKRQHPINIIPNSDDSCCKIL